MFVRLLDSFLFVHNVFFEGARARETLISPGGGPRLELPERALGRGGGFRMGAGARSPSSWMHTCSGLTRRAGFLHVTPNIRRQAART